MSFVLVKHHTPYYYGEDIGGTGMIKRIKQQIQRTDIFKRRYLKFGIVLWFSLNWSWVFLTDSIELSGSATQGKILASIVFTANVAIASILIMLAFKLLRTLEQHITSSALLVIVGLGIFSGFEYLVAWTTALIWIGPNGNLDTVLPLGSLGLPLIHTPLRFVARFVGLYGLAAFGWLALYCLYRARQRTLLLVTITGLVLSFAGWGLYRQTDGQSMTAVIMTETLQNRVQPIDPRGVDIIVFPEYGFDGIDNRTIKNRLLLSEDSTVATFIGSKKIIGPEKIGHYNRLMSGNTHAGFTDYQDKSRLIPGGEDLPHMFRFTLEKIGRQDTINYFDFSRSVLPSSEPLQPILLQNGQIAGAGVCSSIIAPQDYARLTRNGATILTNSASLGTFGGSSVFSWQQQSLARFIATANNRYFLQSANGFSAYAVNSNGSRYAAIDTVNTIAVQVQAKTKTTFYTQHDTLVVTLSLLLSTGCVLFVILQRYKKRTPRKASSED